MPIYNKIDRLQSEIREKKEEIAKLRKKEIEIAEKLKQDE